MNSVLVYILLAFNLIGILYLIIRDQSTQQGLRYVKEVEERLVEQNRKLFKEVNLLRIQVEHNGQMILKAQEESLVQAELTKAKPVEHLYLNDRYKDIFKLKEQGMTTEQIAKTLQKGYGEVAFILDLAQKGEQ